MDMFLVGIASLLLSVGSQDPPGDERVVGPILRHVGRDSVHVFIHAPRPGAFGL
ncbi:MAG: hypothetical protein AAF726_10230 [Planctomycetota bacterium]